MSNRLIFSTLVLGASAAAMLIRDLRAPLEAPPLPPILQSKQAVAHSASPLASAAAAADYDSEVQRGTTSVAGNVEQTNAAVKSSASHVGATHSNATPSAPPVDQLAKSAADQPAVLASPVASDAPPAIPRKPPAEMLAAGDSQIAVPPSLKQVGGQPNQQAAATFDATPETPERATPTRIEEREVSAVSFPTAARTASTNPASLKPASPQPGAAETVAVNVATAEPTAKTTAKSASETMVAESRDESQNSAESNAERFRRLMSFLVARQPAEPRIEGEDSSDAATHVGESASESSVVSSAATEASREPSTLPLESPAGLKESDVTAESRYAKRPPSPYLPEAGSPVAQAPAGAEGAALQFAGGAVQLQTPWDWRVYEVSLGREVRLTISPDEIRNRDQELDGMWVVCHARAQPGQKQIDFEALMANRISSVAKDAAPRPVAPYRIGGVAGYRSEFAAPTAQGFHILIPASWGVCEVHARTTDPNTLRRLNRIAGTLVIGDAPTRAEPADSRIQASSNILGVWKAYRSRLRLAADGRIEIEPEQETIRPLDEAPKEPIKVLRGSYEARDDLLFVKWDDGSFLNFRWRLDGDSLLLTDHEGRVSELRMLLE